MSGPFTELDLQLLRDEFPLRDVGRLAAKVAERHRSARFFSPLQVLRKWLIRAEQQDTDRLDANRPMDIYKPIRTSDPTYAAFRQWLVREILAKHLMPRQASEAVREHASKFASTPRLYHMLLAEADALELSSDWQQAAGLVTAALETISREAEDEQAEGDA